MTSPLDQVSFKLGTVDANIAILIQRADKSERAMAEQTALLDAINSKLTPVVSDVAFMRPHVDHYAGVKRRAVWLGSTILAIGGTIGGALGNYLFKKYGA